VHPFAVEAGYRRMDRRVGTGQRATIAAALLRSMDLGVLFLCLVGSSFGISVGIADDTCF
jgi:hypothetical protein